MGRQRFSWTGTLFLALLFAGCGEDTVVDPPAVDLVAPFVGTWDAEVFTVTNDANTSQVADLMLDGSFTMNVQPSGTYTATLLFGDLSPIIEIGVLRPSESGTVTLQPTGGDPATSVFVFEREDYLTLDGPTDFDFNLDGTPEEAQAYIELQRR